MYSRTPSLSPYAVVMAARMIKSAGLNPADFCIIRNQCFLTSDGNPTVPFKNPADESPFWFIGQKFFRASTAVAQELADWFEDPAMLSDWLVKQQQRSILEQPLVHTSFTYFRDSTALVSYMIDLLMCRKCLLLPLMAHSTGKVGLY